MKIHFYFAKEKVGSQFRLALVRAFAAELHSMILKNQISDEAKLELKQSGELIVYIYGTMDSTEFKKGKVPENFIGFKHMCVPPLFGEKIESDPPGEDYLYPEVFAKGRYVEGEVILESLDDRESGNIRHYFLDYRGPCPRQECTLLYSMDEVDSRASIAANRLFTSENSLLNSLPKELFQQVEKSIPPEMSLSTTPIMLAFKQAIEDEGIVQRKNGKEIKAKKLHEAKDRAVKAALTSDTLALTYNELYHYQEEKQESVKDVAVNKQNTFYSVSVGLFNKTERALDAFNIFKAKPQQKSLWEKDQEKKKEEEKEKKEKEYKNSLGINPASQSEERICIAGVKAQEDNPIVTYGIL